MGFFKLILAFAPWLAFLVIAHGSLFRLKLGLVVALVLCICMGIAKFHRSVILWAGLVFFTFGTIAIFGFENMWVVQHMGILASGTLATFTWFTLVIGKPFTLDYARAHTDPSRWDDPVFIKTNYILTSVWGTVFTLNALLAVGKMNQIAFPDFGYEIITYVFLLSAAAFTAWYSGRASGNNDE